MLITYSSLNALAFIAVFVRNVAAVASSSVVASSSAGVPSAVIQSLPAPTDPPNFQYSFNIIFQGGQCSDSQQREILNTLQNIAGLSDRVKLWQSDSFHDWQDEVDYWFGSGSASQATWIKNNFLRVSTAIKQRKDGWINTWVYVGCNYYWSRPIIACTSINNIFSFVNNYGFYRRWDTIYWNFCPDFFDLPLVPAMIQRTLDDPNKNIHFMENYYGTREQWLFPGLLSIRSIGINKMTLTWLNRIQTPGICHRTAYQHKSIQDTLTNFMSYFYTAMSISIPESFNWGARPVISEEYAWAWSNMDNSNGTNIPPVVSSAIPILNSAGTETYDSANATASAPPSVPASEIAVIGNATFSTLADPAHASAEICFTFLPSISVQGSPSEVCDCGTTTAALTTQGSTTGCALSNSIFAIDQFPTETGTVTPSATKLITAAPIVTLPPSTPTRAFEIMFKDGMVDEIQLDAWTVYSHPIGEASKINACNGGFWFSSAGPSISFPTSLGPFTRDSYSGCMYQGPATGPGSVTCPGMSTWTDCSPAIATAQLCYNGAGYDNFIPQVECEF